MSVRVSAWVFHESWSTGNDRLVLLALADEADDNGHNAYPGIDLLAHKTRLHRATVLRSIDRLEAAGELLVRRPDVHGRGRHNRYCVVAGRDPIALAGEIGWPPPAVRAARQETSQTATIPEQETSHHDATIPPVDNRPGMVAKTPVKGPERSQQTPEMVAPGATRPIDPIDTDTRTSARRRGLDPPTPSPAETTQAAAAAIRARHDAEQAEQRRREASSELGNPRAHDWRAALDPTRRAS